MAYTSAELNLVAPNVGHNGGSLWTYENSADDTLVTQRGAGYISDGDAKGLKVNDYIISAESTGVGAVLKVSAVTAGGAATVT